MLVIVTFLDGSKKVVCYDEVNKVLELDGPHIAKIEVFDLGTEVIHDDGRYFVWLEVSDSEGTNVIFSADCSMSDLPYTLDYLLSVRDKPKEKVKIKYLIPKSQFKVLKDIDLCISFSEVF